METIRLTTAQALVKFLNAQYVRFDNQEHPFIDGIFTIFGHGNVLGIGQAIAENPGRLNVYQGRNEQGMAHAAIAYAKQHHRKRIIACTASVGPGSANMVTAAATATANEIPLLLFPGDVFATRQPDPVLQQIEQTYNTTISTNHAFQSVSRYWDCVTRPEQLMSALLNAMRVLTCVESTGAVVVSLPQDVQGEAWDYPVSFFEKRVHTIERRIPTREAIEKAVQLLKEHKKPLLVVGGGVRYSRAEKEVLDFANKYHIPITETQAGKGAISSHELVNLGGIGVTGNLSANKAAKEADLIIGIGTRFSDFTTGSKSLFANKQILTINASTFHANKLDAHAIVSDAKLGIEALANALGEYNTSYENIKKLKDEWLNERKRLANTKVSDNFVPEIAGHLDHELKDYEQVLNTQLTQTSVVVRLNELLHPSSIITAAAGSLPGDLQRLWQTSEPYTYNMEYGYSCMGYEIAAALGVKLAEPEKEVYALVGDGSFLMLHSELVTSLQEKKKINIVLFDNAGFGCINNLQMGNGMPSYKTEFRYRDEQTNDTTGNIMAIDYAMIGEGYGLKTFRVHTMSELDDAIEKSKNSSISTLIDIKVLPKTMTDGYEAWWHVGIPEVAKSEAITIAYQEKEKYLRQARKY
nr:3D-(3,5/4)-trihydroxycyclohexane-1,2-dione acylhydrolase (decyclizing) [Lysinibacillus timonensis]